MKIVADENIPYVREFFSRFGEVQTVSGRHVSSSQLGDADVLLVRSVTRVNQALLQGSAVRFVGTCTIGTDHLDMNYLNAQGITTASAPGCNAGGVVQYVLSAIASLDDSAFGKTFGILGCGNVGGRLLRALQSLGVNACAYDPFLNQASNAALTDLGQVLASDVICMHLPYTRSGPHATHHIINDDNLPLIKPGAIVLNAGRGGTLDNQALLEHLRLGADLRVVLDVWENEPSINLALMDLVAFATPHIAGYSFEGRVNGTVMVFEALAEQEGMGTSEIDAIKRSVLYDAFGEPSSIQAHDVLGAILASYRIRFDDIQTRTSLKSASDPASAFDALRRGYPQRREFSHFKVSTRNHELKRKLLSVGFTD